MTEAAVTSSLSLSARRSALDPDSVTFVADQALCQSGPHRFENAARAAKAPLAARLFALAGVREVVLHDNTAVVAKNSEASWEALLPMVAAALRAHVQSGEAALGATAHGPSDADGGTSDEALAEAARHVLLHQVNPGVAKHGGRIELQEVRGAVAYVRMLGGCQGCAGARSTLRHGVELMLRRALPAILGVVDVTDHGAGKSPYMPRQAVSERD